MMKYIPLLLLALVNVPFFPNVVNVLAFGFIVGMGVATYIAEK